MPMTRRTWLTAGALSALSWAARPRTALAALGVGPQREGPAGGVLVTIFLRGGADGLNVVVPHGDDDYFRSRPTLGIADSVNLDGFFGLHPSLAPLLPLYRAGEMAVIHACGSGDQTRSHFEAMATVERGAFQDIGPASGWVARHLQSAPWNNPSPLRAVALGAMVPASLRGAAQATALETVHDLRLRAPARSKTTLTQSLGDLYGGGDQTPLGQAGREALATLRRLEALSPQQRRPAHGAAYPQDALGRGLAQVATLMRCRVGLEAACLDHMGYDTHVAEAGVLTGQLHSLGTALAAFAADLGPALWAQTTVVTLSEFGRRVAENDGSGTDHGHGGVMLVLGGSRVAGGQVHGRWPGLAPAQRVGPGDLQVTTDYRDVLAEIVADRLGNTNLSAVFPGLRHRPVGVIHG